MNNNFSYNFSKNCVPIPPSEQGLQSITAEPFLLISTEIPRHLEGVCFDKNGDLYFTSNNEGKVCKVNMQTKTVECLWHDPETKPVSVKLHPDGRMFVSCLGTDKKSGRIVILDAEGTEIKVIAEGYDIDDIVFDSNGGFYFTHFVGTVNNPIGGIYYVTPDLNISCFLSGLCSPNGIALSTDEQVMWITEFTAGRLLRVPMNSPYSSVAYHFTGFYGPDSCSIDADDNVYVAMYGQGRIMIFNKLGYPIGQVLMPNREKGMNLLTTHAAICPGTKDIYITCADDDTEAGSWLMKSPGFANTNMKAYYFIHT